MLPSNRWKEKWFDVWLGVCLVWKGADRYSAQAKCFQYLIFTPSTWSEQIFLNLIGKTNACLHWWYSTNIFFFVLSETIFSLKLTASINLINLREMLLHFIDFFRSLFFLVDEKRIYENWFRLWPYELNERKMVRWKPFWLHASGEFGQCFWHG